MPRSTRPSGLPKSQFQNKQVPAHFMCRDLYLCVVISYPQIFLGLFKVIVGIMATEGDFKNEKVKAESEAFRSSE